MREVVHCKTQQEWVFAVKKLKRNSSIGYKEQNNNCCIRLDNPCGSLSLHDAEQDKEINIISFENWCKLNNYDNPFEAKKEKPKFEVGEWYKCSCNTNLYQFDGFHENEKWGSSAVININNYTYGGAEPGYTKRISHSHCAEYFSPTSLADMKVVNEFLPEVHKTLTIDDLVKGEIYTADNGVIFMYDSGDSAYYYLGELNTCFRKNGGRFYGEFKPATPEQKQWLNACIKADKFISKEEALKLSFKSRVRWKVGDKLEFTQDKTYYYDKDGKELASVTLKRGSYEIGEISTIHPDLFRFLVDKDIWYMESDFKLVEEKDTKSDQLLEEAKRRYPVGSKFINAKPGVSTEYTISQSSFEYFLRHYPDKDVITPEFDEGIVYYKGKWAEIVTDDKTDKEVLPIPKFKKGDRVKVVKFLKDGWFQREYQTIYGVINYKGTIESIEYKEKGIYYVLDSLKPGLVLEDALELIETKKEKPSEFNIGDWVYVIETYKEGDDNYLGEGGNLNSQGPYQIEEINNEIIRKMSNIKVCLGFNRFRKATQNEIESATKKDVKNESKSLRDYVGRYLKALVDAPSAGDVKKGEYGLIKDSDRVDFPSQKNYYCSMALMFPTKYQLMPEGFTPETSVKEKAVIIPESDKVYSYDLRAVKISPLAEKEDYKFKKNDLYKVNLALY